MTPMILYSYVQAWAAHAGGTGAWRKSMGYGGHAVAGLGVTCGMSAGGIRHVRVCVCGTSMPSCVHVAITRQPHVGRGAIQPG